MLNRSEVAALYRDHAPFVRYFLRKKARRTQLADLEDIEQNVWTKITARWPEKPPPSARGYIVGIIKNAIPDFYREKHADMRDERVTDPLAVVGISGPMERAVIDVADSPSSSFERRRTAQRVREIAAKLPDAEAAIYARFIADDESISKKELMRLQSAMRKLIGLRAQPHSVERPDLVEGPSHCGRAVRRLRLEHEGEGEVQDDDELPDAAE